MNLSGGCELQFVLVQRGCNEGAQAAGGFFLPILQIVSLIEP